MFCSQFQLLKRYSQILSQPTVTHLFFGLFAVVKFVLYTKQIGRKRLFTGDLLFWGSHKLLSRFVLLFLTVLPIFC